MTNSSKYSQAMDDFIRDNCTLETKRLTSLFNEKFGTRKTPTQLAGKRKRMGLKTGRTGRFEKGHKTWNAGLTGLPVTHASKATQFKKGSVPANVKPIGHERICSKDGYILIKVREPNPYTNAKTRYRFKHHVIWEKHHGPIQKDQVIRFFDGDKTNCAIENLFCVSLAVNLRLNKHGFNELPIELRPVVKTLSALEVDIFAKSRAA